MAIGTTEVDLIAHAVARALSASMAQELSEYVQIPVGVSARHVHLSPEHIEVLFGKGYQLTPIRELSQPGEFAAKETVTLVGPRGVLQGVRVLGPPRSKTQVEISKTDGYILGIDPPVRVSGDHRDTPGCIIVGPHGAVKIESGVICAMRHIHISPELATNLGLHDGDFVRVKAAGDRKVIFDKVIVRVSPRAVFEMHIDTDEANAAGLRNGDRVLLMVERKVN
ncbi:MAG: Phosphate propanoyltransferase [Thermoanaerobacterales bacterium 50_218]|nr:MAG: Phosphate propanoyltransferase [Thermoanaerobacterales bacterium 50_218]